jgi:hypothetical protein
MEKLMRRTYSMRWRFSGVIFRLTVLAAACLPAATADAQAYTYNVGPNYVSMPGSACRGERSDHEADLYHDSGATTVRANRGLHRLFCPIPRRGTSFYGSFIGGEKVNMTIVQLRGSDSTTAHTYSCATFITDMYNQTTTWGATRYLCSSALGCSSAAASYTGVNTMNVAPPANSSSIFTVNFGLTCSIGSLSSIEYYETLVTPNG